MKITKFATVGWSGFARINKKVSNLLMVICLCIYSKQCQKSRLMRSWGKMKRKTSLKTVEIKLLAFLPHINSMTCTSCPQRVIIIIPRLGEGWDWRILVVSRKHLPSPPLGSEIRFSPLSFAINFLKSPPPLLPSPWKPCDSFLPPPPSPRASQKLWFYRDWLLWTRFEIQFFYFILAVFYVRKCK